MERAASFFLFLFLLALSRSSNYTKIVGKRILWTDVFKLSVEEIKTFCEKHNVVVSAPGIFFISGEHAVLLGAPALCVPIPYRVYVGLERADNPLAPPAKPLISFGEGKFFDWKRQEFCSERLTFLEREAHRIAHQDVVFVLEKIAEKYAFNKCSFRINILSLFPPGHGVNWSGAFSAALAAGVLLLNKRLDPEQVESWSQRSLHKLIFDDDFRMCNQIAWQIENVLHGHRASGYGTTLSLGALHHGSPFLYLTQARSDEKRDSLPPVTITPEDAIEVLPNIYIFACELADLFEDGERLRLNLSYPGFPIRFLLVDSGALKSTNERIQKTIDFEEKMKNSLRNVQSYLQGILSEKGKNHLEISMSRIKSVQPRLNLGLLATSAFCTFYDLMCRYSRPHPSNVNLVSEIDKHVVDYLRVLRSYQSALEMFNLSSWQGEAIKGSIYRLLGQRWERAAVKWTGGGGGGSLVVVIANVLDEDLVCRDNVIRAINTLERTEEEAIVCYWDSMEDGVELKGGVRVESFNEEGPLRVSLKTYTAQRGRIWLQEKQEWRLTRSQLEAMVSSQPLKKCGLYIDSYANRIFYDGRPCSHGNLSLEALVFLVSSIIYLMEKEKSARISIESARFALAQRRPSLKETTLRKYLEDYLSACIGVKVFNVTEYYVELAEGITINLLSVVQGDINV